MSRKPKTSRSKVQVSSVQDRNSKIFLGIALLFLGAILVFGNDRLLNNRVSTSFASEPVTLEGFDLEITPDENYPRRVIVPEIAVDLEVGRSKLVNGFWEVFPDKAGWGDGSGIPGTAGNQVIFAHAREGLFLPLRSIKPGSKVYVMTEENWYAYEVKNIREVSPNQTEVIEPTDDETLTLYTCSGFGDSKRLIVIAKRV